MDEKQECAYRIGMWKVIKRTMANGAACYSVVRYGSPFIERTFDSINNPGTFKQQEIVDIAKVFKISPFKLVSQQLKYEEVNA